MEMQTAWTPQGGGRFTSAPPLNDDPSHLLVSEVTPLGDASSPTAVLNRPCVSFFHISQAVHLFHSLKKHLFCGMFAHSLATYSYERELFRKVIPDTFLMSVFTVG